MKLEFSRKIFEKCSNVKFNKNLFSGSRVVPRAPVDERTDGQTGMMKLAIALRNIENAPTMQ
jgi:hypothetical protein